MSYQFTYPVDAPSELAAGFTPSVVSALGSSWFITVLRSKNTLDLPVAVGAALLASAEGYTPRATQLIDAARERLGTVHEVAGALAENLPQPKLTSGRSRRRKRRKRKKSGGQPQQQQAQQEQAPNGQEQSAAEAGEAGEARKPKPRPRKKPAPKAEPASAETPAA